MLTTHHHERTQKRQSQLTSLLTLLSEATVAIAWGFRRHLISTIWAYSCSKRQPCRRCESFSRTTVSWLTSPPTKFSRSSDHRKLESSFLNAVSAAYISMMAYCLCGCRSLSRSYWNNGWLSLIKARIIDVHWGSVSLRKLRSVVHETYCTNSLQNKHSPKNNIQDSSAFFLKNNDLKNSKPVKLCSAKVSI